MVLPYNQTNLRLLKLSHEIVSLFTGLSVRRSWTKTLGGRQPDGAVETSGGPPRNSGWDANNSGAPLKLGGKQGISRFCLKISHAPQPHLPTNFSGENLPAATTRCGPGCDPEVVLMHAEPSCSSHLISAATMTNGRRPGSLVYHRRRSLVAARS